MENHASMAVLGALMVASMFYAVECQCNLPPSEWCSTLDVARACQVEWQCDAHVWSKPGNDDRVQLTTYVDAFCPYCQQFLNDQLLPTFHQLSEIMDIRVVPYFEVRYPGQVFNCDHDENECADVIETCAMNIYNKTSEWLPFVACMENNTNTPAYRAPQCAKQTSLDIDTIMACTNSSLINKLAHEVASEIEKMKLEYVPYILLNGVVSESAQMDLFNVICQAYKGPHKPAACNSHRVARSCGAKGRIQLQRT